MAWKLYISFPAIYLLIYGAPSASQPSSMTLGIVPNISHRIHTRAFASAAGLGTDAAVLVFACMALAFFRTASACEVAKLEGHSQHRFVAACTSSCECAGGGTHICAVKIEPDALPEFLNHVLRKASIGAADAGLCAFKTLFDTAYERLAHVAAHVRVSGYHVAGFHVHLHLGLMRSQRAMHVNVPSERRARSAPALQRLM